MLKEMAKMEEKTNLVSAQVQPLGGELQVISKMHITYTFLAKYIISDGLIQCVSELVRTCILKHASPCFFATGKMQTELGA